MIRYFAAVGFAATLSGCVAAYPPGPYYQTAYPAAVAYDGYYDGFYGPFYDGYWGHDGSFYYSRRGGHDWYRDTGRHFRHDHAGGYRPVHGHGGVHR